MHGRGRYDGRGRPSSRGRGEDPGRGRRGDIRPASRQPSSRGGGEGAGRGRRGDIRPASRPPSSRGRGEGAGRGRRGDIRPASRQPSSRGGGEDPGRGRRGDIRPASRSFAGRSWPPLPPAPSPNVLPLRQGIELRSRGLEYAGFDESRQRVMERTNNERFVAHYGVSAKTVHAVFEKVKEKFPSMKEKDFLIGLNFLKLYETYPVMSGRWKDHEDTIGPKWKRIVEQIASLSSEEIVFDPTLFDEDEIFWFTVDGVNFSCYEPRAKNPGPKNYDHKSNSAGVSYEVAVAIRHNNIVHIAGPFPASTSEIQRFRGRKAKDKEDSADPNALIFKIPDGKRAVADSGMKGEPTKITTSKAGHAPETKKFLARAKARQETLFARFKNFNVLKYRFRHQIDLHQRCLLAVAVVVQIDMDCGNGLFDI